MTVLLRTVLEFDSVKMTFGGADILAGMCNRVAPLNVTLHFAASGGRSIGEGILVRCICESEHNTLGVTMHSFLFSRLGAELQYANPCVIKSDFIILWRELNGVDCRSGSQRSDHPGANGAQ